MCNQNCVVINMQYNFFILVTHFKKDLFIHKDNTPFTKCFVKLLKIPHVSSDKVIQRMKVNLIYYLSNIFVQYFVNIAQHRYAMIIKLN